VVTAPASVVKPKHLRRLSEKKTSGHAPFCTRASISVPGAPASSGFTCSHPDVEKPGAEMSVPLCGALVLSCTCHPPRPTVVVPPWGEEALAADADATAAPASWVLETGSEIATAKTAATEPVRRKMLLLEPDMPRSLPVRASRMSAGNARLVTKPH